MLSYIFSQFNPQSSHPSSTLIARCLLGLVMVLSSSAAFGLSITSGDKSGTYGTALTYAITVNTAGATQPLSFSALGLPTGLAIDDGSCDTNSCDVVGSPSTSGTFSVTLYVEDSNVENPVSAEKTVIFTIAKKTLTVTNTSSAIPTTKVYDSNTNATFSNNTLDVSGEAFSDTITLVKGGLVGTFDTDDAGTGKTVTASGLLLSGTNSTHYQLPTPQFTVTNGIITKASVTVSGITGNNKVYDNTTTASLNVGSAVLNNVISGDTVTLVTSGVSGTFANDAVGNGKTVTIAGLTLTGIDGGNYNVTQPLTTANITQKPLIISGITANDKVYDRQTTATLVIGTITSDKFSSDTVNINTGSATGAFSSTTVASNKTVTISGITISGTDSGNYSVTPPTDLANITPLTLSATGITATSKVYNGNTSATLTGTPTPVGVITGDTVTVNTSGTVVGTFVDKNAGTGKTVNITGLTLSGADAGNYLLPSPQLTTGTITAANMTVSTASGRADDKYYDGNTSATLSSTITAVGVIGSDNVTLDLSGIGATFADKELGTDKPVTVTGIAITGLDAPNYTFTQPTGLMANILVMPLTVTPNSGQSKVQGQSDPASFTYTVTEGALASGDSFSGALSRVAGETPGNYAITIGTLTASSNYTITLAPANFTINAAPAGIFLTISFDDGTNGTHFLKGGSVIGGYTLTVQNDGELAANSAAITGTWSAGLLNPTWSCVASDGATCAASGTGNIADVATIPAGGSVTYLVAGTAQELPEDEGLITSTVSVTQTGNTNGVTTGNSVNIVGIFYSNFDQ